MSETTAARVAPAALWVACGAMFLAMLDSTVTNVALPAIKADFASASVSDLSWILTAYFVVFAALLATAGRLADIFGRRLVFIAGVAIFTVASLVSAMSGVLWLLVAARAAQGLGAALMTPAALAIVLLDTPVQRRAAAFGLWGATSAVAAAIGPGVGGVLVDLVGWRSVFYINVPVGAVMIAYAWRRMPGQRREPGGVPDPWSTALFIAGVGAMVLGVAKAPQWRWTNPVIAALLIGGLLACSLAIWVSTRAQVPAVETGLWRNRGFLATNIVSLAYGMAQYPWMLLTVLYMVDVWRYGEMEAGLAMTPGAVCAATAALLVGRAGGALRKPRLATLLGLAGFVAGAVYMLTAISEQPAFLTLIMPISLVAGSGMGLVTYGISLAAATASPPERNASASGMNTMARQFGGALGVAVLAMILEFNAGQGVLAYQRVYIFCTALAVVSLATCWLGMRFTGTGTGLAAPAPAEHVNATSAKSAQ